MSRAATLVLGLGETGRSVLRFLGPKESLIGVDTRDAPSLIASIKRDFPFVEHVGVDAFDGALSRARRIVVSPGIAMDDPLVLRAKRAGVEITSDIELFLEAVRAPVIGITGTNGKSTVTTLIGHVLEGLGVAVAVGGNLSPPALDLVAPHVQRYVVELSSFQLERLSTVGLDVALVLNVSDDHLDRHGSIEKYARIKRHIFESARVAIYNADDEATDPARQTSFSRGPGRSVAIGRGEWRVSAEHLTVESRQIARNELPLFGEHNAFNMLAALATVVESGYEIGDPREVLAGYRALPHRGSVVACVDGVRFVDDSKATNVGATVAALAGSTKVVLIAGGDGKGASFDALCDVVRRNVVAAVLIGRDASRLAEALGSATAIHHAVDMPSAVELADSLAREHGVDCVLLSPACASLDMFANFAERGKTFSRCAREIANQRGRADPC